MGRAPCCAKVGLHRGPWTAKEDALLIKYIRIHGEGHWRSLPKKAGLLRCGKSCRLRWMNYLRPDIKRGNITPDEDDLIIKMHALLGNRWSLIAGRLPGRTDNEIKNYWNTHLSKKLRRLGTNPNTHKKLPDPHPQGLPKRKRSRPARNSNMKKQKSSNSLTSLTQKLKVHAPKPVRVKPIGFTSLASFSIFRNNSFEWSNATSSFNPQEEATAAEHFPWFSFQENHDDTINIDTGVGFFIGHNQDHDHLGIIGGSDLECQSHDQLPASDGSLEKLYDEYLELLMKTDDGDEIQLDTCAESLQI